MRDDSTTNKGAAYSGPASKFNQVKPNRPAPYPERPGVGPPTLKLVKTVNATGTARGDITLNAPVSEILKEATRMKLISFPRERSKPPLNADPEKWCDFHGINGHVIDQCWILRHEIERLIKKGHLLEFVTDTDAVTQIMRWRQ